MGVSWTNHSSCSPYSIALSPTGRVVRFEARQGEKRWNGGDDASAVDRTELSHPIKFSPGEVIWLAYSMMIEPGDPTVSAYWNLMGQMHGGLGKSPPLSMNMYYDRQIRVETLNDVGKTVHKTITLERGRWHNFVIRSVFHGNTQVSNGKVEIWVNGFQVVDSDPAIQIGYTESTGNYWKFGIYRKTQSVIQAVQYANMEVGTSSLFDRITKPLPVEY